MFRYTVRDLMGLTLVASFACMFGILIAPPVERFDTAKSLGIAVFGVGCYLVGISVGRAEEEQ